MHAWVRACVSPCQSQCDCQYHSQSHPPVYDVVVVAVVHTVEDVVEQLTRLQEREGKLRETIRGERVSACTQAGSSVAIGLTSASLHRDCATM